jgi:hypothetical protein
VGRGPYTDGRNGTERYPDIGHNVAAAFDGNPAKCCSQHNDLLPRQKHLPARRQTSASRIWPDNQELERKINSSRAAWVGMALAVLGWPLVFYGVFAQMGDPYPSTSPEQVQRLHFLCTVAIASGSCMVAAALWLSGYAFSGTQVIASAVLAACSLPLLYVLATMFM